MSKEYTWKLPVGETEKEVTCEASGNKYFLYIGDAFVDTYYKNSSGDVDEEIELCGIPCRFVAFNEKPDLVVGDKMLSSGKSYAAEKASRTKSNKIFALAEIVIGLFALVAFIIYAIVKGNITAYIPAFVIPLAFILFGIWELYNITKKNKKSKEPKEENESKKTEEEKS